MSIVASTRFISLQTLEYPLSLAEIRQIYPNISIPSNPTESQLIELGYAVVDPQPRPTGDVISEGAPELIGERWYQTWTVRSFTTEELAARLLNKKDELRNLINAKRAEELTLPFPHLFPNSEIEHVQMTFSDQFNMMTFKAEAEYLKSINETGPVLLFRTFENNTHSLTPDQALEIVEAAIERGKTVHYTSWTLKDQVSAATSIETLPSIPEVLVPIE